MRVRASAARELESASEDSACPETTSASINEERSSKATFRRARSKRWVSSSPEGSCVLSRNTIRFVPLLMEAITFDADGTPSAVCDSLRSEPTNDVYLVAGVYFPMPLLRSHPSSRGSDFKTQ